MAVSPLVLMRSGIVLILFMLATTAAQANIDAFEFKNDQLQKRYQHLAFILRCPKCQNQNIIDSDAPIASDLRQQVHRLLHEDYTDEQILDFMVARYGNFVLYEPPVNSLTYLLWYGPAVLVLIGALVVIMMIRSRKRSTQEPKVLNASDRERLDKLLKK
jgi:cytochrome c-type biogenesis protein CcmH